VIHTGVHDILAVTGQEEILIPMVESLVAKIDLKDSLVVVDVDALIV
jgi:ribosomal 30S subunit maturation factor RimM